MFTLEIAKKSVIGLSIVSVFALTGCNDNSQKNVDTKPVDIKPISVIEEVETPTDVIKTGIDGSIIYDRKDGKYSEYYINTQDKSGFSTYGRIPTDNEIAAWDLDVMPDGTGLPDGEGMVEDGDELYSTQCAMCHGEFGIGGKGYPPLVGGKGSLKNQLRKPGDEPPFRTIGSYWPYASTLFWYIKSAMPFPHPKSLTNDEVYAITAYLLYENGITVAGEEMDEEFVLNKENFLDIEMPNKDGFYPVHPDRNDLKEKRGFLAQGERCMSNCKEYAVVEISQELDGFYPPISTEKTLPGGEGKVEKSAEAVAYETYCAACHNNAAIGAPVLGDKDAWAVVMEKGIDSVYSNAINGINAMPPKGGSSMSDEEFKKVVDYMINLSK